MLRILGSFIAIFVFANMIESFLILSAAASEINANDIEEVRDNLVEVRLALQKGDLTEALQHLNNAEEQLLLFAENATANSTIS
jgi:DNA-binding GntR family transcriptional regulator